MRGYVTELWNVLAVLNCVQSVSVEKSAISHQDV